MAQKRDTGKSGREVVEKWSEVVGNHREMVQNTGVVFFFQKNIIIELVTAEAYRFWGCIVSWESPSHLHVTISDLELI